MFLLKKVFANIFFYFFYSKEETRKCLTLLEIYINYSYDTWRDFVRPLCWFWRFPHFLCCFKSFVQISLCRLRYTCLERFLIPTLLSSLVTAGKMRSCSLSMSTCQGAALATTSLEVRCLLPFNWSSEILASSKVMMPVQNLFPGAFLSLGGSSVQPLQWELRLKILIGAARALAFLHALKKQVIYRDFKASDILLDGVS